MGYWMFMLLVVLLTPLIMLCAGVYFKRHAPAQINGVFGYRTERSMKNKDTWIYAHHCFGRLWLCWGLVLLPLSVIVMLFCRQQDQQEIGFFALGLLFVQVIVMLLSVCLTERRLKAVFDEQGRRKG